MFVIRPRLASGPDHRIDTPTQRGLHAAVVRTLTAADEGLLVGQRVLICDRDAKWSALVRARLGEAGIRVVLTTSGTTIASAITRELRTR